jgi:hypothetical protein
LFFLFFFPLASGESAVDNHAAISKYNAIKVLQQ